MHGLSPTLLIPLLGLAFVVRRSLRPQKLKVDRLWVMPVAVTALIALNLFERPPIGWLNLLVLPLALGLGAVAGWYRGRLTQITIDPVSQTLTSKASPLGVLLVAGLFALRYGLRAYLEQGEGVGGHPLGAGAASLTDGLLAFTVGAMLAQRLEIWMRSSRMLNEAMANGGKRPESFLR